MFPGNRATPGQAGTDLDTPALLVDLDAMERNLDRMAEAARSAGVALRPHVKTHKSVTIARMQLERGAVGVCVQTVSEAAAMVAGGIDDVSEHARIGRGYWRLSTAQPPRRVATALVRIIAPMAGLLAPSARSVPIRARSS